MNIPLTYCGTLPEVNVEIDRGISVKISRGDTVEVPQPVADALLSQAPQDWKQSTERLP